MTSSLMCPICGSCGELIFKKDRILERTTFGAKCTNRKCSFEVPVIYKFPEGAYWKWNESCKSIRKIENEVNKNIPLSWMNSFPQREGKYLIALPNNGGIIIRKIGLLNRKWSTSYGPISNLPDGSLFYGPLPEPEFENSK